MEQEKSGFDREVSIEIVQLKFGVCIVTKGMDSNEIIDYEIKSSADGKTELVFKIDLPMSKVNAPNVALHWNLDD